MPWLERGSAAGALLEVVLLPGHLVALVLHFSLINMLILALSWVFKTVVWVILIFWKYLPNVFTLETRLVKNVDVKSSREKKEIQ